MPARSAFAGTMLESYIDAKIFQAMHLRHVRLWWMFDVLVTRQE